ncbi:MAG: hypothetical protein IPM53_34250 [Anaerolineaceae bacterium]|nr:hypothetical protein [Anaerolineaceae bacterium]
MEQPPEKKPHLHQEKTLWNKFWNLWKSDHSRELIKWGIPLIGATVVFLLFTVFYETPKESKATRTAEARIAITSTFAVEEAEMEEILSEEFRIHSEVATATSRAPILQARCGVSNTPNLLRSGESDVTLGTDLFDDEVVKALNVPGELTDKFEYRDDKSIYYLWCLLENQNQNLDSLTDTIEIAGNSYHLANNKIDVESINFLPEIFPNATITSFGDDGQFLFVQIGNSDEELLGSQSIQSPLYIMFYKEPYPTELTINSETKLAIPFGAFRYEQGDSNTYPFEYFKRQISLANVRFDLGSGVIITGTAPLFEVPEQGTDPRSPGISATPVITGTPGNIIDDPINPLP